MKEQIETAFDALQQLDMKPTPHNVSIMDGVYAILRDIYNRLEATDDGGRTENGTADNT